MAEDVMEWWAEIEKRFNEMDPELRGRYEGMLEAWFWDHPEEESVSEHRLPVHKRYQAPGAEIFMSGSNFDLKDFQAVFDYLDGDGAIWFVRPFVRQGSLMVMIATTENGPGVPEDWIGARFEEEEWQEVVARWMAEEV